MKKIYIAGNIRAKDALSTMNNIYRVIDEGMKLEDAGYAVYFPMLEVMNKLQEGNYGVIEDNSPIFEWLKVCDGMLLVGEWDTSKNVMKQIKIAEELNIPIFYTTSDVFEYFEFEAVEPLPDAKCECDCKKEDELALPYRIFVKTPGILGLDEGDALELDYDNDMYRFKSYAKTVDGYEESRTAAISTSLYDKNKQHFTV